MHYRQRGKTLSSEQRSSGGSGPKLESPHQGLCENSEIPLPGSDSRVWSLEFGVWSPEAGS